MSQTFAPLAGTDTLTASRSTINSNADALLTNFAGTAFPTTNIAVGMWCYRTDTQKTYELKSTGPAVWVLVADLAKTVMFNEDNLSALASAATARTNLGLAIGTNVQAYNANLTSWAGLGNWKLGYTDASGVPQAIALGADKTIYASNGASAAPSMRTAANLGLVEFGVTATMTVGYKFTPYNQGTVSSGTYTPDAANGNYQYYTNNGAHTIAAPAADSAIDILMTNGASAGTPTFSGFTVGASTGDPWTGSNTRKFIISIRRINGTSTYMIKALQ